MSLKFRMSKTSETYITGGIIFICPVTCGGSEPSLKMSATLLLRFGIEGLLKIYFHKVFINELMNE